jgi:hypothetical protein
MRRKALVVGIDRYSNFPALSFAEKDAASIGRLLSYDGDDSRGLNFDVHRLLGEHEPVTRARLRAAIADLFANSDGLDLAFYFAGHGHVSDAGGYLVTADAETNDYGVTMEELTNPAFRSRASSVLLMLDCCHSGAAGDPPALPGGSQHALLRDNMTIMASSLSMQQALESSEGSLFTTALRDALDGAAADILGDVTVASVYSLVERRFTLWQQQPVAKSYVTRPIVLRRVNPRLSRSDLRRIVDLFPTPDYLHPLDPEHDPERDVNGIARTMEVPSKIEIGRLFKRYRDAALLGASVAGEDLYYTAQRSHTVQLSLFGREYWRLVKQGRA